ncbi:murein L,D-transpeptidase family protein [Methylococcus sp. EFPC2]|uniref:L,D-transpeptidase family protein n=1 Tax=Methylococcus sp. EFPC2 TaxID=2812648 RepID=UPI0019682C91|nr:L,D-transpeptidase family protein [Methylococcus sp. EFPC2]QSA98763.1 L,D-transpeptidase family protein [Methylococcus sp. EFPC2]
MTHRILKLLPLTAAVLIGACAHHDAAYHPRTTGHEGAVVEKPAQNTVILPPPLSEPGQRSVADVLRDFGPYAVEQLQPYFVRAGVAYPPAEVTLVGLKAEKKLELWARDEGREYRFIRDYDILAASGTAGPKLRQGDGQVPEGIYRIVGLNPNSNFHLSMKLDYPNEYDRAHAAAEGRRDPGSDIFIHGRAVSIGCLAMGDAAIDELFVLVAQVGKERVKVVIAPHDPRSRTLEPVPGVMPAWVGELYGMITDQIVSLSHPLAVSNAVGMERFQPARPR